VKNVASGVGVLTGGIAMIGRTRSVSGWKLLLVFVLALAVGPAGLLGVAGPLSPANAATIYASGAISTDTTWTTAGSPYWVQTLLRVTPGVRLTIEPGVVVKFGKPGSTQSTWLQVDGQLIARGTAAAPIVFTSAKDDSVAGDTNGDGSATSPARGDWTYVTFTASATTQSVIDRSKFRYGSPGYAYLCNGGNVYVASKASLSLTNSDFQDSAGAGVYVASGAGDVRVANNRFYDSGCGISADSGTITENIFESSLSHYAAKFYGPTRVKFYDNYVNKVIDARDVSPGIPRNKLDFQGNSLIAGVVNAPVDQDPQDLSLNWWGHVVDDPATGCYDSTASYSPQVKIDYISGSGCAAQGKSSIVGYFTKVTPALAAAPPLPSAGVNAIGTYAGSVDEAQVYGPDGGSEYAAAPVGSQADPVNTAIGALVHSEADLGLASKTGNLSAVAGASAMTSGLACREQTPS
jgi:hypothetical protein